MECKCMNVIPSGSAYSTGAGLGNIDSGFSNSSLRGYNGLGQLDILTGILSFAGGLFSKSPDKVEYDRVRQQAWDSLVNMSANVDDATHNGTLTRSELQAYLDALTKLMDGFNTYTNKMLQQYPKDAGWINPRFHDYYDFMGVVKNDWQQRMATLPAESVFQPVIDIFTGGPKIPDTVFPSTPVISPMPGTPSAPYVQPTTKVAGFDTTSMIIVGGVLIGLFLMNKRR